MPSQCLQFNVPGAPCPILIGQSGIMSYVLAQQVEFLIHGMFEVDKNQICAVQNVNRNNQTGLFNYPQLCQRILCWS